MLDVVDRRTSTVSAAAAHAAVAFAAADFSAERLVARRQRHTCRDFANDPASCAACRAHEAAFAGEVERALSGDESLSELIACAVSCTDRKTYPRTDGTIGVIPEDKTGAALLALFRAGNWQAFGEALTSDVARRARHEAEIRTERAA